jgi:serine/threonine-protein kinase
VEVLIESARHFRHIMIGTKLAHYEITSHLGTGGMGEVYQATDSKLGRSVAIKLLPEAFTHDADRAARFEREARVLASLNHPNIAAIYGVEESANRRFLVMELVSGETLAERIQRGAIPVEEALGIAAQITEALEAAHEQGVVHRDLKPANVKVTAEGRVKVLDFGLAKAFHEQTASASVSNSPTLSPAATMQGIILGTAAYMSPEQAKGRAVDRRTDIFAFGAVLYEMLTGVPAFDGEGVGGILARVIEREPDWSKLPAAVPSRIRELLRRCLEKDPRKRRRDAGDLRVDIVQAMAQPTEGLSQASAVARSSLLPWIATALAVAAAIVLGFLYFYRDFYRAPENRPLVRLSVDLGSDALAGVRTTVAISPDGARIAFPSRSANGNPQLATRLLSQATSTPLPGTEGAADPFFSPDGQWIGFWAGGKLKKISVLGGAVVVLCDAPSMRGATWGEDGTIIAALSLNGGLSRVSAEGAAPQSVTKLAAEEVTHRWPQILPGGQAALFTASGVTTQYDAASIQAVTLKTGEVKTLVRGGSFGRYVNGQLVYLQQGVLFGVPFDLKKLELRGTPAPLLDDVASDSNSAGGQFDFSLNGTFVYRSGKAVAAGYPVVWLDSSGKTQPLLAKPGTYSTPRVSPDGSRLALSADTAKGLDIYVYDMQRDAMSRLTFDGKQNLWPLWTPDSKHIIYGSGRSGSSGIWWIRADGAGEAQRLLEGNPLIPTSLSSDGRRLIYTSGAKAESGTLPLDLTDPEHPKPGKPEVFLKTPAVETAAVFSPDGRWIAYTSEESGRREVYVRPAQSSGGGKWQISTGGGIYSFWSRDGRELYFLSPDSHIMVAGYTATGDSFEAGKPRVWSETPIRPTNAILPALDLAPDGKRFAVLPRPEVAAETGSVHVTFLLNFFDELRRRAPAGK